MELTSVAASAAADAVTELLSGGTLRLYDRLGIELAAMEFGSPAFGAAESGRAIAYPMTPSRAIGNGAPTRFRAFAPSGVEILTGSVGRDGSRADLTLPVETIVAGAEVLVVSAVYRQPVRD